MEKYRHIVSLLFAFLLFFTVPLISTAEGNPIIIELDGCKKVSIPEGYYATSKVTLDNMIYSQVTVQKAYGFYNSEYDSIITVVKIQGEMSGERFSTLTSNAGYTWYKSFYGYNIQGFETNRTTASGEIRALAGFTSGKSSYLLYSTSPTNESMKALARMYYAFSDNHDWEYTYSWSSSNTDAVASAICTECKAERGSAGKVTTEIIQDSTCSKEGIKRFTATFVDDIFSTQIKDITIPKKNHTEVVDTAKAATYTETGLTEGSHCSVCGQVLVAQDIIPMLKKDGLNQDADGVFRLYKDGALDTQTYGIVDFNGGRFFVANGEIVQANGLISDGQKWYYCSNGQVADYTGLALYDGSWFYVTNGILDTTRAGIVTYDGGRFMVGAGRIVREVNGLIQDPVEGKWYYVAAGQVADYTGLVQYDGAWFYTINGLLGSNFTGDVEYNGSWFHVENGSVVF